jgi:site-specific DNA recombinase
MDNVQLKGNKRAVIYCRVSTDEQADKGYSLPTQLEACERYTRDHGFEVIGIVRDDYTGAVPLETRPEGRKAYDLLRNGAADVLIAYRIDRIVRPPEDGDEWDMPVLIRGLAKLSKEIHVCDRGELKTDFASLLIAMLDARKAGQERRDIAERTSRGRNRKAKEGKIVGSGVPLYGYAFESGQYFIREDEARIVGLIYQWYVTGNGSGPLSAKSIAGELSKMRIKTPGEAKGYRLRKNSKRGSGIWDTSTVILILKNESYAGVLRYGSQQIAISIPPIIERDQWNTAQEQRKSNRKMSARNTKKSYLLRGMVKCGCGNKMTVYTRHGHVYYRCNSHIYLHADFETQCNEKTVIGARLECYAWQYALDIILERDKLLPRLREAQAEALQALEPQRDKLTAIEDDIKDCEVEAGQVAAAMGAIPREAQATSVVFRQLERRAAELDKRYTTQCRKRDALRVEINAAIITDESILDITSFSEDILEGLTHPTFVQMRRWLEYLKVKAEVKNGFATVSCMLKVQARSFDLNASKINRLSYFSWSASP